MFLARNAYTDMRYLFIKSKPLKAFSFENISGVYKQYCKFTIQIDQNFSNVCHRVVNDIFYPRDSKYKVRETFVNVAVDTNL